MRICQVAALALIAAAAVGCARGGGLFRQYEYEEDMHLALDGSATVYVNASLPALNALRGASFDTRPAARIDRRDIRAFFESPVTRVVQVNMSRRRGRRFAHVRMEVADIRRLGEARPFSWSTYQFHRDGTLYIYRQSIAGAANEGAPDAGWTGDELAAFRLHLPSKIRYHNAGVDNLRRGNILVWEQPLADRLRAVPLMLEGRMDTQSILYTTLWLFGLTFGAVAATFAAVIWWVMRRKPAGS